MLKLLSSTATAASCRNHALTTATFRTATERAPFIKALSRLTEKTTRRNRTAGHRRFFSSDSTGKAVEAEAKLESEGSESKNSSAIVPTNPRPEDYLTDPKLLAALQESRNQQAPYAGTFLLKDDPKTDSSTSTEKSVSDLKGKEFSSRLHEVGLLAQISSIQGNRVVLIDHRRLPITEMVSEVVKADHLKDKPYNKDDDLIKATSFELMELWLIIGQFLMRVKVTGRVMLLLLLNPFK